jgi:SM-20-related protein
LSHAFDSLIDSFIEHKVGVSPHFLSIQLASDLKANLLANFADAKFHVAGIGNNAVQTHDALIRKDQIYWLDRAHESASENSFFDLMDAFVLMLNQTCYAGITRYEFHYTMYEMGSFYKKHIDQFENSKSRAFSMIIYLNSDWQLADGGELCIHHADYSQIIAPLNRQCVFFKSDEIIHEVLRTNTNRLSITGWLRID